MAQTPEDKKLELATMHMNDKAETWMQGVVHEGMFWEEFVEEVIERFEHKSTMGLVGEFNKLKQWGDVESYRCKFEATPEVANAERKSYPQ